MDFFFQLKAEKDKYLEQKELIEKEREKALRLVKLIQCERYIHYLFEYFLFQLQEQAKESEYTRRKLEKARQEVVHHMTRIKNEKDSLEREVRNLSLTDNNYRSLVLFFLTLII